MSSFANTQNNLINKRIDASNAEPTMASEKHLRTTSHPALEHQPFVKPGVTHEDGLYRNCFGREGRPLHSEIYVKRGIIQELDKYCREVLPEVSLDAQNYVVVDEICDRVLDVDRTFLRAFERVGVSVEKIVVPASTDESGETSTEPFKTADVFHKCVQEILERGVSKHSCIISVGGGVVNNLCGVLAGMIYRGIHLVHFTTTTMGMLDAALDFKQAFNHKLGKNLLGCYYPASKIIIDPECAQTLSARHIRNGIAEALKHALCQSSELVDRIVEPVKQHGEKVLFDGQYIEDVCKESIEIKAPTLDHYASSDFNEMCPQYGHAVGHAVEALSWTHSHEPLLHGEAVCIGMCVSAEIALARGLCTEECVQQHYDAVLAMGLPAHIPATMTTDMIMKKMMYDKHYVKVPTMGLVSKVGEMAHDAEKDSFCFAVQPEELVQAVDRNLQRNMYCISC